MEVFIVFLFAAIIVEFVVGVLTDKLPAVILKYASANILSLALGVVVAFAFRLDVFSVLGMSTTWAWLAWLLTGILLAGGSKLWHELVSKLRESRNGVDTSGGIPTYFTSTYTNIPREPDKAE